MEYYFEKSSADLNLDILENKRKVRDKMFAVIVILPDKTEQGYWLKKISDDLGFSENDVREEFFRRYKNGLPLTESYQKNDETKEVKKITEKSREERLSENLLAILIKSPELISYAANNLTDNYLLGENLSLFYNKLIIYYNKTDKIDYHSLENYFATEDNYSELLRYLAILGEKEFYEQDSSGLKTQLINIITDLKKLGQKRKMNKLRLEINQAEKDGDKEKLEALMFELKKIMDLE